MSHLDSAIEVWATSAEARLAISAGLHNGLAAARVRDGGGVRSGLGVWPLLWTAEICTLQFLLSVVPNGKGSVASVRCTLTHGTTATNRTDGSRSSLSGGLITFACLDV